jgi:hypothetical protein
VKRLCADAAEAAGDPPVATAPPAQQWLLVEHPGPWGRHALTDSGLAPAAVAGLAAWADEHRSRVVLVRRPGAGPRRLSGSAPWRWYRVDSRQGTESARTGRFTDEHELLELLTHPAAGEPSTEPVYLVCAHGRHDACCAVRGRPVAAALADAYPARTWECSHIGGDRFAANVVLLPHGTYYAHATADTVVDLVKAHEHGTLDLARLRGRSSLPAAAQAAQHHARLATGETGVDALPVLACDPLPGGAWQVRLGHAPGLVVTVRARMVDAGRPLTCSAVGAGRYRVFDLVDLRTG